LIQLQSFIPDRFEFKYILDPLTAVKVRDYVTKVGLRADTNSNSGPYTVNSIYFDTPRLSDYSDKDASLLRRKKLRARIYSQCWEDDPEYVWLEVKHKRNMNIWKERTSIMRHTWVKFLDIGGTALLGRDIFTSNRRSLEAFSYYYLNGIYRPNVVVKYERVAYLDNFLSPVRLTFDTSVRVSSANYSHTERLMVPVTHNETILEIKFRKKMPWWFARAVAVFSLKRTDFSKYRNSVALLRGVNRISVAR